MRSQGPASITRVKRKSSVGQVVMTMLSVLVLFLSAFTALSVPVSSQRNLAAFLQNRADAAVLALPEQAEAKLMAVFPGFKHEAPHYRSTNYCPMAPTAVFVGYVLGPYLGVVACFTFVALGLVGPCFGIHPFAAGGGFSYFNEPGFGYLLALIPTAWVAGMITRGRRTTLSQSLAVVAGLSVTHLCGLMYLFGSVLFSYVVNGTSAALAWQPWVFELARNMTWYPLPYDMLASLALIGIGFPFRWLASTLSAPDIGRTDGNSGKSRDGRFVSVDTFDTATDERFESRERFELI